MNSRGITILSTLMNNTPIKHSNNPRELKKIKTHKGIVYQKVSPTTI